MTPSKLSIILPVYNGEAFLEKAIIGVLQQTYQSWELILVNDGSTDNSEMICTHYQAQDNRIIYVSQKNKGLSAARNSGFRLAQGDYIMYLDADDYIEDDYYEKMIIALENHDADLVISGFSREFIHKNRVTKQIKAVYTNVFFSNKESIKGYLKDPIIYNFFIHVWNKLYRRDILLKHNICFDEGVRFGEDVLYNIVYLEHVKKILMTNFHGYHYMCYETNRLTNTWNEFLPEYNSKLYNKIVVFMKQYWNTDILVIPAGMYLRGCFLNIEKALAANLPSKKLEEVIIKILNANETINTLNMHNLMYLEFRIYQMILRLSLIHI